MEQRTPLQHDDVLSRALGPVRIQSVIYARQRFANEFLNNYVMVKGFQHLTGAKIRDACAKMLTEALAARNGGGGGAGGGAGGRNALAALNLPAHVSAELLTGLEACVNADVYKKVGRVAPRARPASIDFGAAMRAFVAKRKKNCSSLSLSNERHDRSATHFNSHTLANHTVWSLHFDHHACACIRLADRSRSTLACATFTRRRTWRWPR